MRTSLLGFLGYREERNDWPLNQMALLSFIHTLFISAEFRRASAVRRAELHCRGSCVDYFFHPIISNGTVTIRELNSKILLLLLFFFYIMICHFNKAQKHLFSPAHQAGWNRLLRPYLLHRAPHDSRCGEFSPNSLRSLFNPFSFHFLWSARCPVEIPSRHLIKVSSLFTEDISSIAPCVFFLSTRMC